MERLYFIAQQVPLDVPKINFDNNTVAAAAGTAFAVAGAMAVLFILIGAIRYAISAGDQSQINSAKNTIIYSIVGLVLALSGFIIVQFILGTINQ